jgi:hypothetical protein
MTNAYKKSIKSAISDEPVNTYLVRPLAWIFVRLIYRTPITPNQVTVLAILIGLGAAVLYRLSPNGSTALAGLCLFLKDVVDSADGQLARVKELSSRAGRFLDSIGDFVVNLAVFAAITMALYDSNSDVTVLFLGALAFAGTTLRISYHVFYHTSFLHLQNTYSTNRLTEEIREEDLSLDRLTMRLQQVFQMVYGWQDRWMAQLDGWCRRGNAPSAMQSERWYGDLVGLRMTGIMGLGTELFLLTVLSLIGRLDLYLWINVTGLNGLWFFSVVYRRWVLAPSAGLGGRAAK